MEEDHLSRREVEVNTCRAAELIVAGLRGEDTHAHTITHLIIILNSGLAKPEVNSILELCSYLNQ